MKNLTYNIIGAGAIGHLWTCFLNEHAINARLYAKKKAEAKNFQVRSPNGDFQSLVNYYSLAQWQDADVILICVKAHQLTHLCQSLSGLVAPKSPIILMMNGLGLIEIVKRYFPDHQVFHAFLTHGAYIEDDMLIHTGYGKTLLGNLDAKSLDNQDMPVKMAPVISSLHQALPEVCWSATHREAMLTKLIINAIINPITAINGIKNGKILENGELILSAARLFEETIPLLNQILPGENSDKLRQQIIQVALDTRENTSSMLQDVNKGKPTEIDYINGYLISLAKKYALELPRHSQIISRIKRLNHK